MNAYPFYCTTTHRRYRLVKVWDAAGKATDLKAMRRYSVVREWEAK
jgi:hypothetical protein